MNRVIRDVFPTARKEKDKSALNERREPLSSFIQAVNNRNSGIGGYGFCQGGHRCPGSSLLGLRVRGRSAVASGPHLITELLRLPVISVFPKHLNFPYIQWGEQSDEMQRGKQTLTEQLEF